MTLSKAEVEMILEWYAFIEQLGETELNPEEDDLVARLKEFQEEGD